MADQKITDLVEDTDPQGEDFIVTAKSPFGAGSNRKVSLTSLGQAMDTEDTSNRSTFYNTQVYKRLSMSEQGATAANNLDLPRANTVSVTGTTTINGMTSTGISSGTFVILYFSSSLILKHNTAPSAGYLKMYLAGSTDLTVNANDVVMFVKTTAAWREVSRTIA